jgi:hypothetical protein
MSQNAASLTRAHREVSWAIEMSVASAARPGRHICRQPGSDLSQDGAIRAGAGTAPDWLDRRHSLHRARVGLSGRRTGFVGSNRSVRGGAPDSGDDRTDMREHALPIGDAAERASGKHDARLGEKCDATGPY